MSDFVNFESKYKGIMFIGMPRIRSSKPGRRLGTDEEFLALCFGKLEKALKEAERRNAMPIITGNLFHNVKSLTIASRVLRFFSMQEQDIYLVPGEADLIKGEIKDQSLLGLLVAVNLIKVIDEKAWVGQLSMPDHKVSLYGIPSGETLPKRIRHPKGEKADYVIALNSSNVNDDEFEMNIGGCNTVINGNSIAQEDTMYGDTRWIAPGSIVRADISEANVTPTIIFYAAEGTFESVELEYNPEAFSDDYDVTEDNDFKRFVGDSHFVKMLEKKAESFDEGFENDLEEEVELMIGDEEYTSTARKIVDNLFKEIVHDEMQDFMGA